MKIISRRLRVAWPAIWVTLAFGIAAPSLALASHPEKSAPQASPTVEVVQTSRGQGQDLKALGPLAFSASKAGAGSGSTIVVDDSKRYQAIWGVGAALTDSSAFLLEHALPAADRNQVIAELFGPTEVHLGLMRIAIGGTDYNRFGQRYSEDDMPPGRSDPKLQHFSLHHDQETIALLRQALAINPDLKIIASPWTAPAWMKTNHSLANKGFHGDLKPENYGVYARYLVKFIQGYRRAGIPIFAITAQNEPIRVPAAYEGMHFPPAQASLFIKRFLRPALRRAGLSTQIFGTDESWNQPSYAGSENYRAGGLFGQAWHCYFGNPDVVMPRFAYTNQIMSECATSLIRSPVTPLMTNIFNDGANAGLLWNVALDPDGGPVVQPNNGCPECRGVLYINPTTHRVAYPGAYFELGQFGRFLRRGAVRIAATRLGRFRDVKRTNRATQQLHDVAFRNPDGTDVLVVYNNTGATARFTVIWRGLTLPYDIPAGASTTLEWPGK